MVIIDTSVWIDYFNGTQSPETLWLDSQLGQRRLALTDIILCEILQGVRDDRQATRLKRDLLRFVVFEMHGVHLAEQAARNYRSLRSRGVTVRKTIDCLIATYCILGGHDLLHNDHDYDPFETHLQLSVLHP